LFLIIRSIRGTLNYDRLLTLTIIFVGHLQPPLFTSTYVTIFHHRTHEIIHINKLNLWRKRVVCASYHTYRWVLPAIKF